MSMPEEFLRHGAFLRRLAIGLVGDPHRADDVVQEAYLAALQRPPAHGNLRAWLARVVRNLAARTHRTESRQSARARNAAERGAAQGWGGEEPSVAAERVETQRLVLEAVRSLEEPYLTTIVLRYHDGLGPSEIARRTGTPVKTVETRLSRALRHLRARLDEAHDGDRRAWSLALLPLFDRPVLPAAAIGGALVTKRLVFVLVLFVLGSGAVVWRAARTDRAAPSRVDTVDTADATGASRAARATESPDEAPAQRPEAPVRQGLHGRVIDAGSGAGVAGAEIELLDYAEGSMRRVVADGEGRFALPAREGRVYRLRAGSPSHAVRTLRVVDAASSPVTVRLESGAALTGSITDPDGKPVRAARVALVRPWGKERRTDIHGGLFEQSVPQAMRHEAQATATDGRFEMPRVSPGPALLLVTAPGFAPALHEIEEPLVAGGRHEVAVTVPFEAPVRVRVRDAASGEPVRGVRIVPELGHNRHAFPLAEAPLREPEAGLYEVDVARRADGRLATTQLRIECEGYAPHLLDFSGFAAGATLKVVMGRGGRVAGTVHAPGAAVVLISRVMDGGLVDRAPVDAEGRFESAVLPANDDLHVYAYDASLRSVIGYARVRLSHGERRAVALGAGEGAALDVAVRRSGRKAFPVLLALSGVGARTVVFTGADGRFRFDHLEPGRYELFANVEDDEDPIYLTRFVDLGDAPMRVDLDARFVIEGSVVLQSTGRPIAGERQNVEARLVGADPRSAKDVTRVRADGTFQLTVTAPGTWELDLPGMAVDERPRVVVPEDATPVQTRITARLDPEDRVVRVRILDDESGDAIESGSFHCQGGRPASMTSAGGFRAGEAKLDELARGTYRIHIGARGYVPAALEVELEGEVRDVSRTVRLERSNAVRIAGVAEGGAAKRAGVRVGDLLVRYGATRVHGKGELLAALRAASGTVAVELRREGKPVTVSLAAGRMGVNVENCRLPTR